MLSKRTSRIKRAISRTLYAAVSVVVIVILAVSVYTAMTLDNANKTTSVSTAISTSVTTSVATSISTSVSVFTQTTTIANTSSEKPIKVALIMEGPRLDGSYNQIISYDLSALVNASSGNINASYIDNVGPSDIQRVASSYAQQGYNLVIGDANDLGPGLATVAKQFPNTDFACFGGNQVAKNLASFVLWANEGGYVAGYLAAYMTKTGKIGDMVAFKYASQLAWTNAFLLGAKQAAKEMGQNITVVNSWTSTWTDPSIGSQAAKSLLSSGVDVIAEDASGPGSGMQTAVQQAYVNSQSGPFAEGAFVNQNNLGPFMIGSDVWNFTTPLAQMLSQVQAGTFGGKILAFYLHDQAMVVLTSSTVPATIQQKVVWLQGNITTGAITVPLETSVDLMPNGVMTVPCMC